MGGWMDGWMNGWVGGVKAILGIAYSYQKKIFDIL